MNAPITKVKSQRSEPQNSQSEIRTAYPYFHEKRTQNAAGKPFVFGPNHLKAGQPNPRYSASFMFPKRGDAANCPNYQWLWSLAVEAARKMWPQSVDATGNWTWPAGAQLGIKDGDVPFTPKPKPGQPVPTAEEIAKKNEWRRGYWIVEAENFLDPGPRIAKIVNGQPEDLAAKVINGVEQYKSGDFGIVNMHAYAYQNETFGVNYGFDGFCFTREGERIGNASGPKSTAQMFGGLSVIGGMPAPTAAPTPQPQGYAQPAMPAPAPVAAPPTMPSPPTVPTVAAPQVALPPAMPGGMPLPPIPR